MEREQHADTRNRDRAVAERRTWRQRIAGLSRGTKILILMAVGINIAIFLAFAIVGKDRINEFINDLGRRLREMGYAGALIPGGVAVLTSHPPLFGFTAAMTLIGYAWGLWPGLLFGAIASQVGGWLAWFSIRTFFRRWMRSEGSKNPHWKAFAAVMRQRGLPLVVMIRWCPLPYAFGNGIFAAIDGVKFWQYAIANLTFLPRLSIPVFIGSRLRSLGEGEKDPARWWINLGSIGLAIACGAVTGIVVHRHVLAQLEEEERAEEAEALERGTFNYGAVDSEDE